MKRIMEFLFLEKISFIGFMSIFLAIWTFKYESIGIPLLILIIGMFIDSFGRKKLEKIYDKEDELEEENN